VTAMAFLLGALAFALPAWLSVRLWSRRRQRRDFDSTWLVRVFTFCHNCTAIGMRMTAQLRCADCGRHACAAHLWTCVLCSRDTCTACFGHMVWAGRHGLPRVLHAVFVTSGRCPAEEISMRRIEEARSALNQLAPADRLLLLDPGGITIGDRVELLTELARDIVHRGVEAPEMVRSWAESWLALGHIPEVAA
jgi:hypothetical protein